MGSIIKKYKLWIIGLLLALAIVLLWFHYKSTAWERDLTVVFVGYEEVTKLNSVEDIYEIYEITNDTNRYYQTLHWFLNANRIRGET